jgi:hypothetical protein
VAAGARGGDVGKQVVFAGGGEGVGEAEGAVGLRGGVFVGEVGEVAADEDEMAEAFVLEFEGGDGLAGLAAADGEVEVDGATGGGGGGGFQFEGEGRRRAAARGVGVGHGEGEGDGECRGAGRGDVERELVVAAVGKEGMDTVFAGDAFGVGGFRERGHAGHGGHGDAAGGLGADDRGGAEEGVDAGGIDDAVFDLHLFLGKKAAGGEPEGDLVGTRLGYRGQEEEKAGHLLNTDGSGIGGLAVEREC